MGFDSVAIWSLGLLESTTLPTTLHLAIDHQDRSSDWTCSPSGVIALDEFALELHHLAPVLCLCDLKTSKKHEKV